MNAKLRQGHGIDLKTVAAALDSYRINLRALDSYRISLKALDSYRIDLKALDSYRINFKALDRYRNNLKALDSYRIDLKALDSYRIDLKALDSYRNNLKALDSYRIELKALDSYRIDLKSIQAALGSNQIDTKVLNAAVDSYRINLETIDAALAAISRINPDDLPWPKEPLDATASEADAGNSRESEVPLSAPEVRGPTGQTGPVPPGRVWRVWGRFQVFLTVDNLLGDPVMTPLREAVGNLGEAAGGVATEILLPLWLAAIAPAPGLPPSPPVAAPEAPKPAAHLIEEPGSVRPVIGEASVAPREKDR